MKTLGLIRRTWHSANPTPATTAPTGRKPSRTKKVVAEPAEAPAAAPKKRGRPANAETTKDDKQPVAKKARGKVKEVSISVEESARQDSPTETKEPVAPVLAPAVSSEAKAPLKKRGHPPKRGETTKISADDDAAADRLEDEFVDSFENAEGKNYWLLKAEQVDRFETTKSGNKVNTKFTIDDLRAKAGPEAWEGIRNPQARNNLREMKVGDEAFFYASNGKKPGITGIMEIVKAHEADPTAFDEDSPYYDAKNAGTMEDPKWSLVHVEFRKKLKVPVYRPELQKYARGDGPLSGMQEFKAARLSVSKVSSKEWEFIVCDLMGELEDKEAADTATAGGAEETEADLPTEESFAAAGDAPLPLLTFTTIDADTMPSTDTVFPAETMPTSRPASRAPSRKPSTAPASRKSSRAPSVTASRQASVVPDVVLTTEPGAEAAPALAAGLAPGGRAQSRGRGRTPRSRSRSALPTGGGGAGAAHMAVLPEEDVIAEETGTTST